MKNHQNGMVQYRDYVAGWLDSSIHDFLENVPGPSASMSFSLITCLDSNPAPAFLLDSTPEWTALDGSAKVLGTGILLPTAVMLRAAADQRIFHGFDEVWFFPHDRLEPKPDAPSLVGPRRLDQKKLDRLGSWMAENGCSLALGDGEGLNLIVKARGLMKYLLASSLHQPEPTSGGEPEKGRKVHVAR